MTVSLIVATADNRVIGRDNDIPWYLPADLKYFKRTTLGHHIIMGRKCYESIGKPLPKRTNVIVTRNPLYAASGCLVVYSLEEALQLAVDNGEEEAFIIGGAQIYQLALPYVDKLYITEVDLSVEGDVYFPELDMSEWTEEWQEAHTADEKNEHNYVFKLYQRNPSTEEESTE
ncbi:MAG: dihydrofolate reductase [Bacteroidota bacterium]